MLYEVITILATCFATDFFLPEADEWRKEIWAMIKKRQDIDFLILTKRIDRFEVSLPDDWGDGYNNINIGCTVENQALADFRLPLFLSYPIKRRFIACSPLLEQIDLTPYLQGIDHVTVAGESGRDARECNIDWVKNIREQCIKQNKTFWFKSTGSLLKCNGTVVITSYSIHYTKLYDFIPVSFIFSLIRGTIYSRLLFFS